MRNIMRWLLNRYGKQRELIRYKPSEAYGQWVKWPKHITAPTKADLRYISEQKPAIGESFFLGSRYSITCHPTFMWLFDGADSLTVVAVLFPDGSEWEYAAP